MKKLICLYFTLFVFSFNTFAQGFPQAEPSPVFATDGMKFYSPSDFYTGRMDEKVLGSIPENQALSAQNHAQTKKLMHFLMNEGVSMGFGTNPNRDSFFDLYGNLAVDVEMDFPAPQFGETLESEGGKRYFPDHDATHLWALRGIGPRLKDLKDRKQVIHQWAKILMDAEGLATAYNSTYQVREYWNFRFRKEGHTEAEIKRFEEANRAVLSIGDWTYASYMDLVLTNVRGDLKSQYRLLRDSVSYDKVLSARAAGVPELFPPLSERFSPKMEEMFFKYAFAPLFSLASLYRPINGYHALMKSTIELLEYYYSPYYVKWADMFKIGEDLESAKRNLETRIQLFREDRIFDDVVSPAKGRFETQQVRNVLTQQGRKLIEIQELGEREPTLLNQTDKQDLQKWLEYLKSVNDELLDLKERNAEVTIEKVASYQNLYKDISEKLKVRFPVSKYIPSKYRLGYATYDNFWSDPFAIVLDRKIVLAKFVSAKGIWKEALKARFEALRTGQKSNVDISRNPILKVQVEDQLAYIFNLKRSQLVSTGLEDLRDERARLSKLSEIIKAQFTNFDLQIKEYPHLSWDQRIEILTTAEKLQEKALTLLKKIEILLPQQQSSLSEIMQLEAELKRISQQSMISMQKMVTVLDLSAHRSMKPGLIEAGISHMMTFIVESLGTPLKFYNVKMLDPHLTGLYKFHLRTLEKLATESERVSISSWWNRAKTKSKAQTVCSVVSFRCVETTFIDKLARIDLVDRKSDPIETGKMKSYLPIKDAELDLLKFREQMRAEISCRKAVSP